MYRIATYRIAAKFLQALAKAAFSTTRKAALSFLFCLLFIVGADADAHSPHDRITGLAVSPGFDTDKTLLCTLVHINTYILRSEDGGVTWQPSQIGFPHHYPSCVALSPDFVQDGVAFVGTEQGIVYKSTDGGTTWAPVGSQPLSTTINHIAFSPAFGTDQTLFIGTSGLGIFKSTDGGANWATCSSGLGDLRVHEIAVSPDFVTDQTLFAATEHGLYKSTDSGATWFNPISSGIWQFIAPSVALSPAFASDQVVYVGVRYWGAFRSDDGGATWTWRGNGLSDLETNCVALSPSFDTDRTVYLAAREAVHKSTDGGTSWTAIETGLSVKADQTDNHYKTLKFSPGYASDRTLFLGGWEGIHISENDSSAWRQLDVFNQNMVRALAISPEYATDGTLFVGAYGGGVYRSQDSGDTWIARDTGLDGIYVAALVVSPSLPTDYTVFVGNANGVERSLIGGNSWRLLDVNPTDFVYMRALAISPDFAVDRTLIGANGSQGTYQLYKSTNGGNTFDPIATLFAAAFCLEFSPGWSTDQIIYAGTNDGVYRTEDGGTTWLPVGISSEDILSLAVSPGYATDGTLFAGSRDSGLHRSTDFGATWETVNNGITDLVIQAIGLSPNFQTDGILFAATKTRGLFISTDSGATWTASGLEGKLLRNIVVSPAYDTDQTLFVGAWDGVHKTTNSGATWDRVLRTHRWDDQSEYLQHDSYWSVYRDTLASAKRLIYASASGAQAGMHFSGDAITWIGVKAPFAGIARVYIDGVQDADVDLYSPSVDWQEELYTKTGLGPGPHEILISVTGTKNPLSTGTTVIIDAFDVSE